jgi:16S rRNA (adenine1518-N6/adenine1519-N6)-dimethyltransferase
MQQIIPNKSLGQHWLSDQASLEEICEVAELKDKDTVLEVGPGLGTLTTYLLKTAELVVAVEFDPRLAKNLIKNIKADNLQIYLEDILKFDLSLLPKSYKLVANIPYYLSSNLIRKLSEATNPPSSCVLLVQKEVAQRMAAQPGKMSLLSVTSQFYWKIELGSIIKAYLFTPPPKVDSQIIKMIWSPRQNLNESDQKRLFRVVKAGFSQRRKTLANSLSGGLGLEHSQVVMACQALDIDPKRRAQTLTINEWLNLYPRLT